MFVGIEFLLGPTYLTKKKYIKNIIFFFSYLHLGGGQSLEIHVIDMMCACFSTQATQSNVLFDWIASTHLRM